MTDKTIEIPVSKIDKNILQNQKKKSNIQDATFAEVLSMFLIRQRDEKNKEFKAN